MQTEVRGVKPTCMWKSSEACKAIVKYPFSTHGELQKCKHRHNENRTMRYRETSR
jgi:hypothetical protein